MLSMKFCFEASFLLSRVRESGKTSAREILFGVKVAPYSFTQGGKRPGGETSSPLLVQCVMRRRTGTSTPSALPVQLMAAENLLSTNRK